MYLMPALRYRRNGPSVDPWLMAGPMPDDRSDMANSPRPGETLVRMAADALATEPTRRAAEFRKHWYTFGDLKGVADQVCELIGRSGADQRCLIAFAPRNR